MKTLSEKKIRSGFSLVEVVLALAVVAVAIPSIIGLMGVISNITESTIDDGEAISAVNSLQLYLNGKVSDPVTTVTVPFETIYGWVYTARQNPDNAQVLYAYKEDANQAEYNVSESLPGFTEGKIMAAEILAPETSLLPVGSLMPNPADYAKPYLPLELSIYSLSAAEQQRAPENFVDSYPLVISR